MFQPHTRQFLRKDFWIFCLAPNSASMVPPAARGALFEKTAPLDPPQKLLIGKEVKNFIDNYPSCQLE